VLRNFPHGNMTVKEFLTGTRTRTLEAQENQDYPFEDLVEKAAANINRDPGRNPLFDVMFVLQNIYTSGINIPGLKLTPYNYETRVSKFDLTFICVENEIEGIIHFTVEYGTKLFKKGTIQRWINYFKNILSHAVDTPGKKIGELELISEEEKNQVLVYFNKTVTEYPKDRTIPELFEEQVEKSPDHAAVVGPEGEIFLSYREFNKRTNQLATRLRASRPGARGINAIVGIMVERSIEMVTGIFAILKAGGAYLPIDPESPPERLKYILEDSKTQWLLTQKSIRTGIEIGYEAGIEVMNLDDCDCTLYEEDKGNLPKTNRPGDLAYIIYTSGSTGRPKGVLITHGPVVNILVALFKQYPFSSRDSYLLKTSYTFDVSVTELFGWFLGGGRLTILKRKGERDPGEILEAIACSDISHINFVPSMFGAFLEVLHGENIVKLSSLKYIFLAGEALLPFLVKRFMQLRLDILLENIYGPTESTIYTTGYSLSEWEPSDNGIIPIGKPLPNIGVYILDKYNHLQAVGVPGELYIRGAGLALGYLNQPGLTVERFVSSPFLPGERMYRTGDLTRWFEDGNIEFLGRLDQQVKIRGFRIELGEIENRLLKHREIKEAVVLIREDKNGDKYLCAYMVCDRDLSISSLRESLSRELPNYMIPTHFMMLGSLPFTTSGKLDRKALPDPVITAGKKYIAPRDKVEEKLVETWSEILGIEGTIGIEDNFFELGGHSLNATIMAAKLHKEFEVRIPLAEIFKAPRIDALATYIKEKSKEIYISIEPLEKKEYYPLSSAQKRLYILQQMDLASTAYNMPTYIPIKVEDDITKIEETFKKLIKRHENFRTSFYMVNEEPVQRVHDEVDFEVEHYKVTNADPLSIITNFTGFFTLSKAPLFRAALAEVKDSQQILLIDMHHIISDGTSQVILEKNFMTLYQGKQLPYLRLHYKDYSEWQNSEEQKKLIRQQESYWIKELSDEPPVLQLPIDYPRPLIQGFEGGKVDFMLTPHETQTLKQISRETGATLYMVILSVYTLLLSKLSGQEDIIVGTPVAARRHADLQDVIGMFVNTLVMRNYPTSRKTFKEFLIEVKRRVLEAFEHQEYQFEDLVDKVSVRRDASRNPLFDVMFNLLNQSEYRSDIPGIDHQPSYEHRIGTSKFDLNLTAVDRGKQLFFNLEYSTPLFKTSTIERIIGYFRKILSLLSLGISVKLSDLEIMTGEEKEQILNLSRGAAYTWETDQTIHQLFQQQVAQTPDAIALVETQSKVNTRTLGPSLLTYGTLNQKANQLALTLRNKGITRNTIVGVILKRSFEMIIGILAVMKAGGAYLPIDPEYPEERKKQMLEDSKVKLLLTNYDPETVRHHTSDTIEIIDLRDKNIYPGEGTNLEQANQDPDLLYVIYTSGSTGKPKGVMLEHRNLVNLMEFQYKYTNIDFSKVLQFTTIGFDVSFQEIFSTLLAGGQLYLIEKETRNSLPQLFKIIRAHAIKTLFLPPSYLKMVFGEAHNADLFPRCVRHIVSAGEQVVITGKFREYLRSNNVYLHNHYGPSETHVVTTLTLDPQGELPELPSIGKPIANTDIYIMDNDNHLQLMGVPGELVIGGVQVGRGYRGREALTAEKFIPDPFTPGQRLYRTGDLARWLPDGNLEFLGRIDHQVKIRGFRIELGEIESQLLNHPRVKECAVLAGSYENGDKYLCAYIAADKEITPAEWRQYLSRQLPDYMIPSYFVSVAKIPLTPNGKIDRSALPSVEIVPGEKYIAPRDAVESRLADIWKKVLMLSVPIGIDDHFFELGGHSLNALNLLSIIHKEFDVEISLQEIFKNSTIRGIAAYIKNAAKEKHTEIEAAEEKEYYELSSAQKRLYIVQQIDPDSTAYNIPTLMTMEGNVDIENIKRSFKKLVERHEIFKTSFEIVMGHPVQKIHKDIQVEIRYYEKTNQTNGQWRLCIGDGYTSHSYDSIDTIIQNFIRPFDLSTPPLLRVALIKKSEHQYILMTDRHHIISDAHSNEILIEELQRLYLGTPLPQQKLQYKDFSQWETKQAASGRIKKQEDYWLKELGRKPQPLNLPTDYPRKAAKNFEADWVSFKLDHDRAEKLRELSKRENATMYMVILAIFNVLLHKIVFQEDIIVGTVTAGRRHSSLENIIGFFVNTLVLKNNVKGDKTFIQFLREVRTKTLDAFDNQDYQFEDLVEKLALERDPDRNPLFDVLFAFTSQITAEDSTGAPGQEEEDDLTVGPYKSDKEEIIETKFDLTFTGLDSGDKMAFRFTYSKQLFKKKTIEKYVECFKKIVSSVTENEQVKLNDIEIFHDLGAAAADIYDDSKGIEFDF
jgi:tyrocidine synthetase-3